jgi:hypothetical protein
VRGNVVALGASQRNGEIVSVQAWIQYYLNERGRRDSLRKGGDGKRLQTVSGDLAVAHVEAFTVDDEGKVYFDATVDFGQLDVQLPLGAHWITYDDSSHIWIEWDAVPSWEDLVAVACRCSVAAKIEEQERQANEEQRRHVVETFFRDPTARAAAIDRDWVLIEGQRFENTDVAAMEARRRLNSDVVALKARNQATLGEWIAINGTENQQQRLTAGLLPWQEAYNAVDESLYTPLKDYPPYCRFDPASVCVCFKDEYTPLCDIKFRSVDATELSAEEWDQYAKIRAAVPGATFQLREHSAKCKSASEPQVKRGVIVKFSMWQLGFKREFALTGAV